MPECKIFILFLCLEFLVLHMLNVNVVIFTTHMKTLRVTPEHVTHHLHKNSHIAYVLPHPHAKALRATYHMHKDLYIRFILHREKRRAPSNIRT